MSNTNLGVLLASRPSQVDRPHFSEKPSDISHKNKNEDVNGGVKNSVKDNVNDNVKTDAKDNTKDSFKDRMSSVERRHEDNDKASEKASEKTSREDIRDKKESDVEKNDVVNTNNDKGVFPAEEGDELSLNKETKLQNPVSELLQQDVILANEDNILVSEIPLVPVIPELSQAVQKAIALEGNASKPVNPLAMSTSGALPAAEFFNKLSINGNAINGNAINGNAISGNAVSANGLYPNNINNLNPNNLSSILLNTATLSDASMFITGSSEGAAFDVTAALNKEIDKPTLSPLIASPLQANKVSTESLLPSQLSLNTSFKSAGQWGEAVTEKVMWMSSKGIKEATIQLDPPELGSLQIKVGLTQDQAQVSFTVQNPSVREALDQQSMRLREMFAEDGLNLTDVDVSDQSSQEESGEEQGQRSFGQNSHSESDEVLTTPIQSNNHSYSLIDAYI
ncbi:Flagellar hook-length control protein fliK [gamma proteobacterium IMCC1989]|nr:Flagellar hook-length control protein fliK [gamma proteobacterium IMCC1989]